MADPADYADQSTELQMAHALANTPKPPSGEGLGPKHCPCGNEIPLARRKLRYGKCVECAMVEWR